MGIESINNVMGFQVQQENTSTKKNPEYTGDVAQEKEVKVDDTTSIVASTKEKESGQNTSDKGPEQSINTEQIKKTIDAINKRMYNSEAIFGIHDATNRVTIKIVDKTTKEVIKELPAEKTLDMIAKAWELAGIVVDEKR